MKLQMEYWCQHQQELTGLLTISLELAIISLLPREREKVVSDKTRCNNKI